MRTEQEFIDCIISILQDNQCPMSRADILGCMAGTGLTDGQLVHILETGPFWCNARGKWRLERTVAWPK